MTIVIMITTKSEWVWMDMWGSKARWVAGEKGGGARYWLHHHQHQHQHQQVCTHFPFFDDDSDYDGDYDGDNDGDGDGGDDQLHQEVTFYFQ